MTIGSQIVTPEIIERIRSIINGHSGYSRYKLSQEICRQLGWRSANGSLKEMSCRKVLLKLHGEGIITLPEARKRPPLSVREDAEPEDTLELEAELSNLGPIELILIEREDRERSRSWNRMMSRHHYLGAGPLCGAQLRYLIQSSKYGMLGGLSFSAAAWRVEARDRWIGWDEAARRKNLDRVVCNSRFLILPTVRVSNLASHVLSRAARCLSCDWQTRYGIEPVLLETFVDAQRFEGTCYQAANWIKVGRTKGRGRQDFANEYAAGEKLIYLLPLREDAAKILCDGAPRPVKRVHDPEDWAEEEMGMAKLGDRRRVQRLLEIARAFYAHPQANIPQASRSRAKTKATYRFLGDVNNTMEKILTPHHESTLGRVTKEKLVLAVQDTTYLNYSTHPATENLGVIGSKPDGLLGLVMHDTMCFNGEGTPLGLLDVQVWARDPAEYGKKHLRHALPIEQKESNKWLKSFQKLTDAQKRCPNTVMVSVGDREADIYEFFHLALSDVDGPKLLVRAEQDRLMADGQGHVWDYVAAQPEGGIEEVHVPRRGNQKARTAQLKVSYAKVTLKPPWNKLKLGALSIWAILAEEIEPPAGIAPLKWMLLTTCPVETFEDAVEKLHWYYNRWNIEIYHRTLKSGCKIEQRQLGSAERIEACLAIDMVVAWRIHHLTKLGREIPDVPCTVFFEDCEWKALVAYKTQNPTPPPSPPTLQEAIRMVAALGGFLGRKGDGQPGTQTLWLGLQSLDDITAMWKIFMTSPSPDPLSPRVSSDPDYG